MLNLELIHKKFKSGVMKITLIKKLVKNKLPNTNGLFSMKCGPAKKIYHVTFLNIKNTGKHITLNLYKFKLLKMNLKKSKLP